MILTCPECATRYHLDPLALTREGRVVRCASCGHRWQARPPADAPMLFEAAVQAPSAEALALKRPGMPPEPRRRRSWLGLMGCLAGIFTVMLLGSAVVGRDAVVAAFPASAHVYEKLGLPVSTGFGLEFESISSQQFTERGVAVLVVEGRIINVSGRDRAVPPVRVTLLDAGGRPLQEELVKPKVEVLAVGGATGFSGRVVDPDEQARNFSVTFDVDTF